jgi:hypothetical protein
MEHTLQHPVGLAQLIAAALAVVAATAVVLWRNGTASHEWLGRVCAGTMLAVNVTA